MITVDAFLDRKGHHVHTMSADDTVLQAARVMTEQGIGCIVVTEGREVTGIFTERDMVRDVVLAQRSPAETSLGEVMTSSVLSGKPDMTLDECGTMMSERRIRRLPVVSDDGLVGIVTSRDVLASKLQNHDATIEDLVSYLFTSGLNPRT
jgi:CBS domain-containing protein